MLKLPRIEDIGALRGLNRAAARVGLVFLCFLVATDCLAQEEPSVATGGQARMTLSAAVQLRANVGFSQSEDETRVGFGIRRARFKVEARIGPRAGMLMQLDGASGQVSALDFYGYYQLSNRIRLRLGRMPSAQPRALITSMTRIDAVGRAAIAERWGQATIGGDGRDFGLDLRYRSGSIEASVFLHNGDGDWRRTRGNYRPDITDGSATQATEQNTLAVTGAFWWRSESLKGLEAGGFGGYNGARNPFTERNGEGRRYATYGIHAYYGAEPGSQPFRLKVDAVGITYESTAPGHAGQNQLGISILGAIRLANRAEVFVRGEALEVDTNGPDDADGYFTAGLSFSPSRLRGDEYHRERITVAWARFANGIRGPKPEDLLQLQLQLIF